MSKFERSRRAIDVVASAVTIVAGLALCYVILGQVRTTSASSVSRQPLSPGMSVKKPQGAGDATAAIVFVQSACRYCTESMPFYRQLAQAASEAAGSVRLVFVSSEEIEATVAYLETHDIQVHDAVKVAKVDMKEYAFVAGTPTLLVVDSAGRLVRGWRGKADEAGQSEIFTTLRLLAPGADNNLARGNPQ